MSTPATFQVGDRVRLWLGPPKRGGWQHGDVIGVDTHSRPGVEIQLDNVVAGMTTVYATHDEVQLIERGS